MLDAAPGDGGDGLGPDPTRTLESALAACGVMTMRMYAQHKGWPLESAAIEVKRAPGADAHAAREFEKSIELKGALDAVQRARLVEIADRCPVHKILSQGAAIRSSLIGNKGGNAT
ncbi:MAG: OsmC family protein [Parvularculaceae bacterium]